MHFHTVLLLFWGALALLWMPLEARAAGLLFQDDFSRADAAAVGNGWVELPSPGACKVGEEPTDPTVDTAGKEGPGGVASSILTASGSTDHAQSASIRNQAVYFYIDGGRGIQSVRREFDRRIERISFDFMPLYAMGGLDDRAWIGATIQFLNAHGQVLGEIRDYYFNAGFDASGRQSPTLLSRAVKGPFDGNTRHVSVPVKSLLEGQLPDIAPKNVVRTRVSFSLHAGWCGSVVEAYLDDVQVFAAPSPLFPFSADQVRTMLVDAARFLDENRGAFPGNWINHVRHQHGSERVADWVQAVAKEVPEGDHVAMVDLMRKNGLTGAEAFGAAQTMAILIRVLGR